MTVPHSITDELAPQLLKEIACNGPMQLDAFMQASAVHYYSGSERIGASGDFTTAPEISQLFGEMIAAFLTYLTSIAEADGTAFLFEAGPGRGTLLFDMKRCFAAISPQLDDADIILLETSPVFRTLISELTSKPVSFIAKVDALPHRPFFGVANEFFDALGTRQLIFDGTAWCWHLVDKVAQPQKNETPFRLTKSSPIPLSEYPVFLPDKPEAGTICEVSPAAEEMMRSFAVHIAQFGGALIICDYGKTTNQGDTVQALYKHQPVTILSSPGNSDITHVVDFSALARVAQNAGARLVGPVEQGVFLREIGIMERAEQLRSGSDPEGDRALLSAVDRLISPAHMGSLYKVALLVPAGDGFPPGFSSLD
mgnify:CR=1 FL=1